MAIWSVENRKNEIEKIRKELHKVFMKSLTKSERQIIKKEEKKAKK